jgi:hypothetical protein
MDSPKQSAAKLSITLHRPWLSLLVSHFLEPTFAVYAHFTPNQSFPKASTHWFDQHHIHRFHWNRNHELAGPSPKTWIGRWWWRFYNAILGHLGAGPGNDSGS